METNNYYSKLGKHFEEAVEIKESYETAKGRLVEEYETKKLILNQLEEKLKILYVLYTNGEESESNYLALKSEYEMLENNLMDLSNKIDQVNQNMVLSLEGIINKFKEIKATFDQEMYEKTNKYRYQLMKAKYDFLLKAIEVRNAYLKFRDEDYEFLELYEKMGLMGEDDYPEAYKDLSSTLIKDGEGAISSKELYKALNLGRTPTNFKKELRKLEEQTFLLSTD